MKKIGLIGGLSPHSTAHYYQIICGQYNRRFGALNFPELTIESLNLQRLVPLFEHNDWGNVAAILLDALARLQRAGAEFAAILANTPHNAYDLIDDRSPLPVLTIMDATAQALLADVSKRVGLLGTRATMEVGFFQKHFQSRGIETVVPSESQRRELDRIIWEELSHGTIKAESQAAAQLMMNDFATDRADGIVLGCTELCLLIEAESSSQKLYDTTRLHATAILDLALGDENQSNL